jgi:hypothetical protein
MSIPQQAATEIQNQASCYWASSSFLSATTRLQLARRHHDQYAWLDAEFANLRGSQIWLVTQHGSREAHLLLDYLWVLAPYLQQRGLQAELERWCDAIISPRNWAGQ